MNIKLLWLLASGKLGYLRQGWLRTQKVEPLKDYLWYKVKLYSFWVFAIVVAFCAMVGVIAGGLGAFSSNVLRTDYPYLKNVLSFVLCLLVPLGTLIACFAFAVHYAELVKPHWYKSEQFVTDVYKLTHLFSADIDAEPDILVGNAIEIKSGLVPENVRESLRKFIIFHARQAIEVEEQKKFGWEEDAMNNKSHAKDSWEMCQRLNILGANDPIEWFYMLAKREIEAKKPASASKP